MSQRCDTFLVSSSYVVFDLTVPFNERNGEDVATEPCKHTCRVPHTNVEDDPNAMAADHNTVPISNLKVLQQKVYS